MAREFYRGAGRVEAWPNLTQAPAESLSYDDVILRPQNSGVESRSHVDTSIQFGPYSLRLPLVSAPMDTISGEKMIRELARLGGIGSLPRPTAGSRLDLQKKLLLCEQLTTEGVPAVYTVGLREGLEHAKLFKERGAEVILVDAAHGGMEQMKTTAAEIKSRLGVTVIAGNIAAYDQAEDYQRYGIDIARVGVGAGGMCTTRLVAATGMPQLSAIFDTSITGIYVIADGGVRYPGDAAKAIAAGAKMVMVGSMLAGFEETPGEVVNGMKIVRGQASSDYMKDNNAESGEHRAAEGITAQVPAKGAVKHLVHDFSGGLRSAMSYTGAANIEEFQQRAQFVYVSASAQQEAKPHITVYNK